MRHSAFRLFVGLAVLCIAGNQSAFSEESEPEPSRSTAYVIALTDLNVVARFRGDSNRAQNPPAEFTSRFKVKQSSLNESIRVEFLENSVRGFGDRERQVHCVLVHVHDGVFHYGMYGLWRAKERMDMPLPTSDESVALPDTTAEQAIARSIQQMGFSKKRSDQIVARFRDHWSAPGFRALMFSEIPVGNHRLPTIHWYEHVSDQE